MAVRKIPRAHSGCGHLAGSSVHTAFEAERENDSAYSASSLQVILDDISRRYIDNGYLDAVKAVTNTNANPWAYCAMGQTTSDTRWSDRPAHDRFFASPVRPPRLTVCGHRSERSRGGFGRNLYWALLSPPTRKKRRLSD